MYKLILIAYVSVKVGGGIYQQEIGQYPSKQACSDAANNAVMINRTPAADPIGWSFICVPIPGQ
jgi:hypothetical protein